MADEHPAKRLMEAKGITSGRQLAAMVGSHQPDISNWLNGNGGISKQVGRRIAHLLGVSVEVVLFDWSPPDWPPR